MEDRAADGSATVTPIRRRAVGFGFLLVRRAMVVFLIGAIVGTGVTPGGRAAETVPPVLEPLVDGAFPALPEGPLFLGLARVVVPPGISTDDVGTPGPRLLVIESGEATVATAGPAEVAWVAGQRRQALALGAEVTLGPGDRIALGAGAARSLRNDGAKPAVLLDAALFPTRDIVPAFTTPDGISFRLLAGAIADAVPAGPVAISLTRIHLLEGAALPADPQPGPTVAYVEAGSLAVTPTAGAVQTARAAAATPFSSGGPLRAAPLGAEITLAAGGTAFLATGAVVTADNPRGVPAALLVLAVVPAADPATSASGS